MFKKLMLYESNSLNPYLNLSTEEVLLNNLEKDSLLLYLWQNENTVVIGRNQNPLVECDLSALREQNCLLARRKSGGGAVYHDLGNLNFTFIAESNKLDTTRNLEIIRLACEMAGIKAEVNGRNDITAEGKKFSGNAFYNSKGKSFHHGTIMINTDRDKLSAFLTPSAAKLEAKGVKSVRSRVINLKELSPSLTVQKMKNYMVIASEKILSLKSERLDGISYNVLKDLEREYSNEKWILGATPPFSVSYSAFFSWGNAEILLDIEKNTIKSVGFFTDSLDYSLPDRVKNSLIGVKFIKEDIASALPSEIAQDILSLLRF